MITVSATLEDLQKGVTIDTGEQLITIKKIFDSDKSFKKYLIISNIVLGVLSVVSFLLPYPLSIMGIMSLGCIISHTWLYCEKKRKFDKQSPKNNLLTNQITQYSNQLPKGF